MAVTIMDAAKGETLPLDGALEEVLDSRHARAACLQHPQRVVRPGGRRHAPPSRQMCFAREVWYRTLEGVGLAQLTPAAKETSSADWW